MTREPGWGAHLSWSAARVRKHLQKQGRRVRSRAPELIVAATAVEHELTLVTRNRDDYRHIPGLKLL